MKTAQKLNYLSFTGGLVAILALDLVSKYWAVRGALKEFTYIEGILYTIPVQENDGVAFGLDLPLWLQVIGSVIILYLLFWIGVEHIFRKDMHYHLRAVALGTVMGGGLANLYGRIADGYVVDFIVLKPFPVFNFADIGITVGLIVLFVTILLDQKQNKNLKNE